MGTLQETGLPSARQTQGSWSPSYSLRSLCWGGDRQGEKGSVCWRLHFGKEERLPSYPPLDEGGWQQWKRTEAALLRKPPRLSLPSSSSLWKKLSWIVRQEEKAHQKNTKLYSMHEEFPEDVVWGGSVCDRGIVCSPAGLRHGPDRVALARATNQVTPVDRGGFPGIVIVEH